MDGKPPAKEFGRRLPARLPDTPPAKRSNHVALLVMGTLAVGGGAYALMPSESCVPTSPGMAAPALPQTGAACTPRSSSGGGGGGGGGGSSRSSSRFSLFGGDSSSRSSSVSGAESSAGVTRGGFGSLAHAFGFAGG
jgi:hypothetical protein